METRGSLLIVEDDPIMGESLKDRFSLEGFDHEWVTTAEAALVALARRPVNIVISDIRLPGMSGRELLRKIQAGSPGSKTPPPAVIMITGGGSVSDAVAALKEGAVDYITKPFDLNRLVEKVGGLCQPENPVGPDCPPLGVSPAMRQLEQLLPRVAEKAKTVLLTGDSGVGKECVARRIHFLAGGASPFVALNCAALPEALFEGELFGHEKGAYTGADKKQKGLLEAAHGGTLFLDEIGELSLATQAKLLRVVQEREFIRIGGAKPIAFDSRIVFATNRDLRREVEKGSFREDLFYRINVIQIRIPPLRERREDIPWLALNFINDFTRSSPKGRKAIDPIALEALSDYGWPGNVRELKHLIERACILTTGEVIGLGDLWEGAPPTGKQVDDEADAPANFDLASYLQHCERNFISKALDAHSGQVSATANALGISRKALWEKSRRLGLAEGG